MLTHAYRLSRGARGTAGVDGVDFADIEAAGVEPWLAALRKELQDQTYRPSFAASDGALPPLRRRRGGGR